MAHTRGTDKNRTINTVIHINGGLMHMKDVDNCKKKDGRNLLINKKVRFTESRNTEVCIQVLKTRIDMLIIGKTLACNSTNTIYYGPD